MSIDSNIGGRSRRCRERCQRGCVRARDVRDVSEVNEFEHVAIFDAILGADVLMLVIEVLAIFGEAHACESLFIEGRMVASAQKAVAAEDERGLKLLKVFFRRAANVAREFS